ARELIRVRVTRSSDRAQASNAEVDGSRYFDATRQNRIAFAFASIASLTHNPRPFPSRHAHV
ncbi:MAG TPA: hypothetical protein VFN13_12890, partial [Rudaea sp.]|nr:hypothetical protein [Rudaea sp.]